MPRPVRLLALLVVSALLLVLPGSAAAFPLEGGCTAQLTSLDADGSEIDTVQSGADDATMDDPFLVDWDGTVAWSGSSGSIVFGDFTYGVSVFGIPTPLAGTGSNDDGATEADGAVGVGENIPIEIVGLFLVSGQVTDTDGNECRGEGWLMLRGDPTGSVPFWVAGGMLGVGLLLLVLGRRSIIFALLGGLLAGLGAALMGIILAVMVLGGQTPWLAIGAGLVVGLIIWLLFRRTGTAPGEL